MSTKNLLKYLPEGVADYDLFVKMSEILQYLVDKFNEELADTENKYVGGTDSEEILDRVLFEYGYSYVADLADSLTTIDASLLLSLISLLHFKKGTQEGLSLILELLGFEAEITNWYEEVPVTEEHTYSININVDLSNVPDLLTTLEKIKVFSENYVYPVLDKFELTFTFQVAEGSTAHAGFTSLLSAGSIIGTL
jgi:hypothetical protein